MVSMRAEQSTCPCCRGRGTVDVTLPPLAALVVGIASEEFCVPPSVVMSKSRRREVVRARAAITAVLRFDMEWTIVSIARLLSRDHTTLIHATQVHWTEYKLNPDYRGNYDALRTRVLHSAPMLEAELNNSVISQAVNPAAL